MVIGLAIGLAVLIIFGALELAGEVIGVQMGFGVVQLFDPTTAEQTPSSANTSPFWRPSSSSR